MNLVDTFLKLISIESETGKENNILDFIETFLKDNNFQGEIKRNNGGIVAVPSVSSKKIALVGHVDTVPVVPNQQYEFCLLYTSPSPRDSSPSRMPSYA